MIIHGYIVKECPSPVDSHKAALHHGTSSDSAKCLLVYYFLPYKTSYILATNLIIDLYHCRHIRLRAKLEFHPLFDRAVFSCQYKVGYLDT